MKRVLVILALLCGSALAQVDIPISTIGPYVTLARGVAWGASGVGNIENSYIYTPQTSQSITCVYVANNNPTNSHAFTINLYTTGDPKIKSYAQAPVAIQDKWRQLSTTTDTVAANSIKVYSFTSLAAAFAQVQITGTTTAAGSPDTADLYLVESQTNIDCQSSSVIVSTSTNPITVVFGTVCPLTATAIVTTGSTATLVAAPGAGKFIHVCSYQVSGSAAVVSAQVPFQNGSAGTCAAPGTDVWELIMATGNGPLGLSSLNQLFQTTVSNQPLCFTNNASGSVDASITYNTGV